jgi:CubicO group peptidase (beta-lactamase class C family)
MALVERGVISLGITVRSILPEFDGDGRETVTLRHLLTHTSGVIYESPEMEQRLIDQTPIDEIIDEAYTWPLQFPPGTKLSYSDYGYALAGRVAARVAGMSFPDLVRTTVLEPAGLTDTYMPPPRSEYGRLAYVEGPLAEGTPGAMYNSPYALDLAHPAFGTVSTVADLLRFGLLFDPNSGTRIFSEATVRTMTTDQTNGNTLGALGERDSGAPMRWGIGFMIKGQVGWGADLASPATFGHGGASGCSLQVDPVNEVAVAYVSNKHARTGREPFTIRQQTITNVAIACLTRR